MLGSYKIRTDLAVEARERFTEENVEVRGVEVREEYNEEKEICHCLAQFTDPVGSCAGSNISHYKRRHSKPGRHLRLCHAFLCIFFHQQKLPKLLCQKKQDVLSVELLIVKYSSARR